MRDQWHQLSDEERDRLLRAFARAALKLTRRAKIKDPQVAQQLAERAKQLELFLQRSEQGRRKP
jgi:TRAP-type mannitol/chloroaromatic compound transport system substrate-binding protein